MESTNDLLERIVINPRILVGKPVIKGTRLSVEFIVGLMAKGWSEGDILTEYPNMVKEDIQACLLFAQQTLADSSFFPASAD